MEYSFWQLAAYFFIYSVLGWVALAAVRSLRDGKFINFGVLNGPVCPSCGFAVTLCVWLVRYEDAQYIWQFLLCSLVSIASHAMAKRFEEQMAGQKLRGSLNDAFAALGKADFYVQSLLLGFLCMMTINLLHPLVFIAVELLPLTVLKIIVCILMAVFVLDSITSGYLFRRLRNENSRLQANLNRDLDKTRMTWGNRIFGSMRRRLYRAYPEMEVSAAAEGGLGMPDQKRVFAKGYGLTKMIWVFFLCALVGDLVEMVYCRLVGGHWMSRSSLLYGPFSMVWGGGAALGVAVLEPLAKKNDRWIFLGGFICGGAYEYLCSVVTEVLFGKVFWDYSDYPLNINGRTTVLYMSFWGIAAVVLVKIIYPHLSDFIEKIPPLPGLLCTWVIVVLMALDITVSVLALGRYSVRAENPVPTNKIDEYLDVLYPDELVETRWENMLSTEE